MTDMASVVSLIAVTRRYGTGATAVMALEDVTIEMGAGQRAAIVGPSGSGKTTFLSLLGLLDRPSSGTICFRGNDVAALSEDSRADLRRDNIGFVFQLFHLLPALTALDNVIIPLMPYAPVDRLRARGRLLLEQLGLKDRLDHRPAQLSGGEQQRVAIARALISEPQLVIADEPTGNLDSQTSRQVVELLLEMQDIHGFAFVVGTHDQDLAAQLERRIELSDGRLVGDVGSTASASEHMAATIEP